MTRPDRLATLYLARPFQNRLRRKGVPILMYHNISEAAESKAHPYYWTGTSPTVFAEHMRFLHEHRYKSIGLAEAVRRIDGVGVLAEPGEKVVVITFDDGYADFLNQAFPVLNKYGFTATVFLPTGHIGEAPLSFKGAECLTWSEVRMLRHAGIDFGSHTVTHPQLKTLAENQIRREVRESKDTMEQQLGCAVASFAYPYAFPEADRKFTQWLSGTLQDSGYEFGVSTIIGTADRSGDRLFMKRLPVNSGDDLAFLAAKLEGAYDWLHAWQYARKLRNRSFAHA